MITDHYSFPNDFYILVEDEEHSYRCIISSLLIRKKKELMILMIVFNEEIGDRQIYGNYRWKIEPINNLFSNILNLMNQQ